MDVYFYVILFQQGINIYPDTVHTYVVRLKIIFFPIFFLQKKKKEKKRRKSFDCVLRVREKLIRW